MSKGGLTATTDQYKGDFMYDGSNYYPIATNANGTGSFQVEFVHTNKTTPTSIYSLGVTLTNPDNYINVIDLSFKSSIDSAINFNFLNINLGTTSNAKIINGITSTIFTSCKFLMRGMSIGDNTAAGLSVRFINSAFIQIAATGSFIWFYNNPQCNFVRCLINSALANSQGGTYLYNSKNIKFNSGVYFYGDGLGSALYSNVGNSEITITEGIKVKNYRNYIGVGPDFHIGWSNKTSNTDQYTEFEDVINLLSEVPTSSFSLDIPFLYGSLPTNLVYNVSTGYTFVNLEKNISVSVPGIYGEYSSEKTMTLIDNSSGNTQVGVTGQNKSSYIKYNVTRGSLKEQGTIWFDNKNDTNISIISEFDDCGVSFGKEISGSAMNLTWTTTNTGTDAVISFITERIMI